MEKGNGSSTTEASCSEPIALNSFEFRVSGFKFKLKTWDSGLKTANARVPA
jgi:hypothetical protein